MKGRNYWHRDNNLYDVYTYAWDGDGNAALAKGNTLKADDPRLVNLFLGPYDSFTSSGQGRTRSPVSRASTSPASAGPPAAASRAASATRARAETTATCYKATAASHRPDLDYSANTFYIWGHFVKDVVPAASTSGTTGGCASR